MAAITVEGRIEKGRIYLPDNLQLPDRAKIYIVIPDDADDVIELPPLPSVVHLRSPHLADTKDATRLQKVVVTE